VDASHLDIPSYVREVLGELDAVINGSATAAPPAAADRTARIDPIGAAAD